MNEANRAYARTQAARRYLKTRGGSYYLNSLDESARAVLMQSHFYGGSREVKKGGLIARGMPSKWKAYPSLVITPPIIRRTLYQTAAPNGESWTTKYDRLYRVRVEGWKLTHERSTDGSHH